MSVRRRRECEKVRCGYRFSTSEEVELLDLSVVKRDGSRQPYIRQKIIHGLQSSLQKRPYTEQQFRKLMQKIERELQKQRSGEVTSTKLGEIVMNHLRSFDKVAYIRFASVYYSFEDLDKFEEELARLSKKRKGK
jgi:transcriptional repressor NrdR